MPHGQHDAVEEVPGMWRMAPRPRLALQASQLVRGLPTREANGARCQSPAAAPNRLRDRGGLATCAPRRWRPLALPA